MTRLSSVLSGAYILYDGVDLEAFISCYHMVNRTNPDGEGGFIYHERSDTYLSFTRLSFRTVKCLLRYLT